MTNSTKPTNGNDPSARHISTVGSLLSRTETDMTQGELQLQFDELARKGRRVQTIAVPWSLLLMLLIGWRWPYIGKHLHDRKLAPADILVLAACVASIAIFIVWSNGFFDRNAPTCPNCCKILTFNEHKIILEKNRCPYCMSRIIDRA